MRPGDLSGLEKTRGGKKMKIIWTIIVIVVIVIGGGAIFIWSGAYNVGADQPGWKITDWLLEETRDRSIEVQSRSVTVPLSIEPAWIENGKYYFYGTCQICHGAPGYPPDKFTKGMDPRPPDLTAQPTDLQVAELFWIIKNGIRMTGMASFGVALKDDEIWGIVGFLKQPHKSQKQP
jgi:hypothetical protein